MGTTNLNEDTYNIHLDNQVSASNMLFTVQFELLLNWNVISSFFRYEMDTFGIEKV